MSLNLNNSTTFKQKEAGIGVGKIFKNIIGFSLKSVLRRRNNYFYDQDYDEVTIIHVQDHIKIMKTLINFVYKASSSIPQA